LFEFNLSVYQTQDIKNRELRYRLEKEQYSLFEMCNGFAYRKKGDKFSFYMPSAMEQELMYKYYEFGQFDVDKTHAVLLGIQISSVRFAKDCSSCCEW